MANASASSVGQSLPEASSRCLAQGSTAAHNFEVTNFSLLDGMGVGKSVSSSTFSVGGFAWCINFYPDGADTGDKAAHVSAFLNFKGGGADARVKFSLSVLGKGGQVARLLSTAQTFKPAHARWGWKNLIQKSDLQPLLRLNNDRFTIRCVLTVIKGPQVEDVRAIVVPHSSLLQDFARLLKDGEGADVEFSVGGRLFPAHRCVLAARSAVFRAELLGAVKEKDAWCIQIDDMEPTVFEALLHFIYSDSLPEDWDADKNVPMQHLLVAADRYGLDRLRLMCEGKMSRSIDEETVATTLALAEQHHCVQLKRACLEFIASGGVLGTVMGTDGFVHLGVSCPLVLLEILDKLASLRI